MMRPTRRTFLGILGLGMAVMTAAAPLTILHIARFDFDKAVLTPSAKQEADKVIDKLKEHPDYIVIISGHTDDIGSEEYNMALGLRRANAVRNYMVQMGINPARTEARSMGETTPAVPNTTPANRKINRRVEMAPGPPPIRGGGRIESQSSAALKARLIPAQRKALGRQQHQSRVG